MGRLTRNPDVRYSQGEKATCVARYTLAVNRRFRREGDQDADFINCVAFGRQGEFAEKYLKQVLRLSFPEEFRQVVIPIVTVLRFIQQMLLLKNRNLLKVNPLRQVRQQHIHHQDQNQALLLGMDL